MRKLVLPVAVVALVAAVSVAYAADAVGVIKSIDTAKDMITLDNGSSYWASSAVKLSGFKVGEKVDVTYTATAGKMEMSALKPAA
jgi:hypothetical protein